MQSLKCVVIGDGGVGKTCLVLRYTSDNFYGDYVPNVFETSSCPVMYKGSPVSISIWDTAGQESYDYVRPLFYENTDVFILCFSLIRPASFYNARFKWLPELREHSPTCPVILVGTQLDLLEDPVILKSLKASRLEPIDTHTASEMASDVGAAFYIECSSLTQEGIHSVFQKSVEAVLGTSKKTPKNIRCNLL